jgi:Ca2+-binding RTX toxin-like protein
MNKMKFYFQKSILFTSIIFISTCSSPTKSQSILPPTLSDLSINTNEDVPVEITLQKYRIDGEVLVYTIITETQYGELNLSSNIFTYVPQENYNGVDTFSFKEISDYNDSNVSTVTITINVVNDAPIVEDINDLSMTIDQSIDVILAGSDVENDNLTFSIVNNPSKGTVSIEGNAAHFIPTNLGEDSFTYKANDGIVDSNEATVFININSSNTNPGDDTIYGTANPDTLYAGAGNDNLFGLGGRDVLYGESGDDIIDGGDGLDKLYGGDDNDILKGSDNFDELYGGEGDDILDGGDGKDSLYGGNGNDIFIGRSGDGSSGFTGANIIYDFEDGVDKIRLEGDLSFSNVSIAQGTQGTFTVGGQTFYYDYRNHTLVSANNEYLFTIIDTNYSTISSEDFIN